MVKCPNCGRKTSGDYCQWCGSPIPERSLGAWRRRGRTRKEVEARAKKEAGETEKRVRKEAEQFAGAQAKKEAEEWKKTGEAEARARKEAGEAEKRAKKEAEQLAREQAKKEAEEKKAKEAEARAKKEAEEEKKAGETGARAKKKAGGAEKRVRKEAEQFAREQAKQEAEEAEKVAGKAVQDIGSATYEGDVQLVLLPPVGFKQVRQFAERLEGVKDLKVVWIGGLVDEGVIIGISAQKPVPLVRILSEMPVVEKVDVEEEKIVVMLKASAVS